MILEILRETLQITAFVAVMMVVVEYLNVLSRGLRGREESGPSWASRGYSV
jgi:hypothetical protein